MDIALVSTENGLDVALDGDDLRRDSGLVTSILVSLFSDARVDPKSPSDYLTADRRGFWADNASDRWGSKLWTLARAKATAATAEDARRFTLSALAWLTRDGIAAGLQVEASYAGRGSSREGLLRLEIKIERSRGWRHIWAGTIDRVGELEGLSLGISVT